MRACELVFVPVVFQFFTPVAFVVFFSSAVGKSSTSWALNQIQLQPGKGGKEGGRCFAWKKRGLPLREVSVVLYGMLPLTLQRCHPHRRGFRSGGPPPRGPPSISHRLPLPICGWFLWRLPLEIVAVVVGTSRRSAVWLMCVWAAQVGCVWRLLGVQKLTCHSQVTGS